MTIYEKRMVVMNRAFEYMLEKSEKQLPDKGKFMKFGVLIRDPETNLLYQLLVDIGAETQCVISAGCLKEASDKLFSNYMFFGDKAGVPAFFKSEDSKNETLEALLHLAERCAKDD